MPGATRTNKSEVLKRVYEKVVTNTINRKRVLKNRQKVRIKRAAEGERVEFALEVADNWGVSITGDTILPNAQHRQHAVGYFNYRYQRGQVRIDGPTIESTSGDNAAYVNVLNDEVKGMSETMRFLEQIALWGDGTGKLGTVAAVPTADATYVSIVLDTTRYLRKGMMCDLLISGEAGAGGFVSKKVQDVIPAADTVKFLLTDVPNYGSVTTSYKLYVKSSYNTFPWGVQAIVDIDPATDPDVGQYCGIARATNTWWRNKAHGNGGTNRAYKETLLQDLIDDMENNGTADPDNLMIFTNPKLWSRIGADLAASKRYAGGGTITLDGWFKALSFGGIPVVKDAQAPSNRIYVFDTSSWYLYQTPGLGAGKWMDMDGSEWARVEGEDAYQATWKVYYNNICTNPGAQGVLFDITEN